MGRIRTKDVKSVVFDIVEKNPEKFSTDFEANKTALNEMKIFPEKFTRNKVAGYVTRVMKSGKRK